jgi:hypothetical protein
LEGKILILRYRDGSLTFTLTLRQIKFCAIKDLGRNYKLLLRTREVPGSFLDPKTGYPD